MAGRGIMVPTKGGTGMYRTVKHQIKNMNKSTRRALIALSQATARLRAEAAFYLRRFFHEEFVLGRNSGAYAAIRAGENYRCLPPGIAHAVVREMEEVFAGIFYSDTPDPFDKFPTPKSQGTFAAIPLNQVQIVGSSFALPCVDGRCLKIKIPPRLQGETIVKIRILPQQSGASFEAQYTYEAAEHDGHTKKGGAVAIDLGVENLMTCATDQGKALIIDGRALKGINQGYNKENRRLAAIKVKQGITHTTRRQLAIAHKRANRVNDYLNKAAREVIRFCLAEGVSTMVLGYSGSFQQAPGMGKVRNQTFACIPFGKLRAKLAALCRRYGIRFVLQEESFTSKASFFDWDYMPIYGKPRRLFYAFSGSRVYRGAYIASSGYMLNADVNGALNILRKSNVVSLWGLFARGEVDTPVRIRVH